MMAAAKDPNARIAHGFRIITARTPNAREQAILQRLYAERLAFYKKTPKPPKPSLLSANLKRPKHYPTLNTLRGPPWHGR